MEAVDTAVEGVSFKIGLCSNRVLDSSGVVVVLRVLVCIQQILRMIVRKSRIYILSRDCVKFPRVAMLLNVSVPSQRRARMHAEQIVYRLNARNNSQITVLGPSRTYPVID